MPKALYVIEEYIATVRKKPTIWMVFNRIYNDIHRKKIDPTEEVLEKYLKAEETDYHARDVFLAFMKTNFPDIDLHDVFDFVPLYWIHWPYLGSIAIDADIGSPAYIALSEKYGDPYENSGVNNANIWIMEPEDATEIWKRRELHNEDM